MLEFEKSNEDLMTPIERYNNIKNGKSIDRLRCFPNITDMIPRLLGVTAREYWHSSELMVKGEILGFNKYGYDWINIGPDACGITGAIGSEFLYSDQASPNMIKPCIDSYDKIDSMDILNPYKDGRIPLFLETCERLKEKSQDLTYIRCKISAPFTLASLLRGTEGLLKDVRKNPEGVKKLLEYVTECTKEVIKAFSKYDVAFQMADPVASTSLISPKTYDEFVVPYTKEIIDFGNERSYMKPLYHICGNTKKIWPKINDLDIEIFSIDNIMSLEEAVNEFDNKISIMGNVDPVDIMLKGDKENIYKRVKENLEEGKKAGDRYIIAPGCGLPELTPFENIQYFMDAAREYGRRDYK